MSDFVRFDTINSTYEVDKENDRIRRIESDHEPTPRQSEDGVWDEFATIEGLEEGGPALIVWDEEKLDDDNKPIDGTIPCTYTSEIQTIYKPDGVNNE
jgi:hypothetical protein